MKRGYLSDYFVGVGVKRLSAVDAEPKRSNQHEIGTTREMREQFLGEAQNQKFNAVYMRLDQDQDHIAAYDSATHYDAREKQAHRAPEYRLYYPSNDVTNAMREGDTLFLALHKDGTLYFIVTPAGSTSEQQIFWLFGVTPTLFDAVATDEKFITQLTDNKPELDFAARLILDEIGIEFEEPQVNALDEILKQRGFLKIGVSDFPSTADFSKCARETHPELMINAKDNPDAALIAWLDHEKSLFRRLERHFVSQRLEQGFVNSEDADVDGFIAYSLQVQNRRKSRMGHSLENHLQAVFDAHEIKYVRGAVIDKNQKPDFLFPDVEAYNAASTGDSRLAMLGAKSTCKDRWPQVLTEASKIPNKHLLTLEPGISESQTERMRDANLQLVVPESIQASYTEAQQGWLPNLGQFIEEVAAKQAG